LRTDDTDSVTGWIRGLGTSKHKDASKLFWDRYFAKIARLARGRLQGASRGPADGKDVALSVFDSFFRGAAAGRFDRLDSRDNLWRLLVTIAARKAGSWFARAAGLAGDFPEKEELNRTRFANWLRWWRPCWSPAEATTGGRRLERQPRASAPMGFTIAATGCKPHRAARTNAPRLGLTPGRRGEGIHLDLTAVGAVPAPVGPAQVSRSGWCLECMAP
jgi:hypothetical protein